MATLSTCHCVQQLQEKEVELGELQEEMARGTAALEEVSAQLELEKDRGSASHGVSRVFIGGGRSRGQGMAPPPTFYCTAFCRARGMQTCGMQARKKP